ncbi:bifunctional 3'-5' exonuclease/DNA polymerase, partial [Streptomyces sp. NPDC001588]
MTGRWALAPAEDGGAEVAALGPDGLLAGPVVRERDLVEAVRARPEVTRWVWRSTADVQPRLLATGVRVDRCYDVEAAEALLLGHEGRLGEPRSAAAALARLRGAARLRARRPDRLRPPGADLHRPGRGGAGPAGT